MTTLIIAAIARGNIEKLKQGLHILKENHEGNKKEIASELNEVLRENITLLDEAIEEGVSEEFIRILKQYGAKQYKDRSVQRSYRLTSKNRKNLRKLMGSLSSRKSTMRRNRR